MRRFLQVMKMESCGTRLLFILVVCFVVSVCEGRGGGRGGGGRSRTAIYRYRFQASHHTTFASVGMIVGVTLGTIAGVVCLVVAFCFCISFCCSFSSSSSTTEDNTTRDMLLSSPTPAQSSNTANGGVSTSPSSIYNNMHEAAFPPDRDQNADPPPSYDTVVSQKEGAVFYPAQPDNDYPYSSSFSTVTQKEGALPYPAQSNLYSSGFPAVTHIEDARICPSQPGRDFSDSHALPSAPPPPSDHGFSSPGMYGASYSPDPIVPLGSVSYDRM